MAIPQYGMESLGNGQGIDKKVGKIINATGAAAVSLTAADSGATIVIAGGTNGAAACNLPHILGQDGLEFTFLLVAANGTGDWDIDARDGVDFFHGSIVSVEDTNDVGIDFASGSSHDQLTLAASKGAAGDQIHIMSAGGRWWVKGVTNDQDGWAVGTASANT